MQRGSIILELGIPDLVHHQVLVVLTLSWFSPPLSPVQFKLPHLTLEPLK